MSAARVLWTAHFIGKFSFGAIENYALSGVGRAIFSDQFAVLFGYSADYTKVILFWPTEKRTLRC